MAQPSPIDVYLEIGKKRVIAGVMAWPGWCRSGRDANGALQSLTDAAPRYARALVATGLPFAAPAAAAAFVVVEELPGTTTTDFGAPDVAPAADAAPLDAPELERLQVILEACWAALALAVRNAMGHELRLGPRGGGRTLDGVVGHVLNAQASYLGRLAWKHTRRNDENLADAIAHTQQEVRQALAAAAHGTLPERGPRGGTIWLPRYFVRRAAWHILDHAWEIEDRVLDAPSD
jgi:hypothetical protein